MSFLANYFDVQEGTKEIAVCCPFDHLTGNGTPYKESNPSAHVNLEEKLYHCKVCNTGFNETQFINKLLSTSLIDAKRIQKIFLTNEDVHDWDKLHLTHETTAVVNSLKISDKVAEDIKIKSKPGHPDVLIFPVLMYGHLMDIRTYNPKPDAPVKVSSRAGSMAGLVLPFDTWQEENESRLTLICAGEKDMAVARSHGFNAITLTGGEGTLCRIPEVFRNRKVAIVYDNDGAGKAGASRLANQLVEYTNYVKVVENFHETCCEKGEDISDFFNKYGKTRNDLIEHIESTPLYVPTVSTANRYPLVDLLTASQPNHVNKILQSNIQVVAVSEASFTVPGAIWAEKFKDTEDKDTTMSKGDSRDWELDYNTCGDILHLMDNNFKEEEINKNIKGLLKIPYKERCVSIKHLTKQTVFKANITDLFETTNTNALAMEYTAYSIGQKLESGKKYLITFKLVPHPYKGQQLVMIILNAVQASDSVSNFQITDEVKQHLNVVKDLEGTVAERMNSLTEKFKGLLGYNGNNLLIQTIDLAYHTALEFNFGTFKGVRGYLDTLIIGESRTGKSSTAETMRQNYSLGTFTSLAGASATIAGLIGGSNKTASGGFQTRAGVIPQNHQGLIIFEELSKCNANVVAELTDVRSSNEVRITRVSGTIKLPALVRMITLSNVRPHGGTIKPIASYPNGISVVTELIHSAEDIARYDIIAVLADKGNSQIDPFWEPEEPLPEEVYRTRVRWVWSRKPEQIIIDKEVGLYIMEVSNALNQKYDSHIKIFGTEAWKKVARLSIAVAGILVSTDATFSNIVVHNEHVDYACALLERLYDNPTFKLKEYVEHERRYSTIDDNGIAALQDIFNKHPGLVLQLEQCSSASRNVLGASTGLGNDDLNKALVRLTKGLFVRFENHDIIPTERFRLGLAKIDRKTDIRRVGE